MNPPIHTGENIRKHLAIQKRSIAWLSAEVSCDPSSLRKLLKKPHIPADLLYRISVTLDRDFFAYYSQLLTEIK